MYEIKFSQIDWGATFKLAMIRLASASLIVMLASIVSGSTGALGIPVILGALVLIALVSSYVVKYTGLDFLGLLALPAFLVVIAGDPPLWIARKFKPDLLPVDEFGFLNRTVLFVEK